MHFRGHQQPVVRADAARRAREGAAAHDAQDCRQAGRDGALARRRADALAHARSARHPDYGRQGDGQRRRAAPATDRSAREGGGARQDRRSHRLVPGPPLCCAGRGLARFRQGLRRVPRAGAQPVHDANRAARLHRVTLRHGCSLQHHPDRPCARHVGVHLPRLLQAARSGGRGRLVDDAAQGQPDRLRECGGEPRPRQRHPRPPRRQAAHLARPARPDGLDCPAQPRRRARPLLHRIRGAA
mmetsp:Transcript_21517/g.68745  ORF Transcript_21517/g.68745 Transcript_21517/m.68745 type:complete len:242 (+) Transcript_21517:438-1163(+)